MNVLFVGAHPDDIETMAGGTAARYAKEGHKLFFCVATNGNIGSATLSSKEIAEVRHKEALTAARVVGAELIWLDFDDEFLMDTRETRLKFIDAMRIARPDVVFCHWIEDYNPDHSISGRIMDDCIHMAKVPLIKTEHPPTTAKIPPIYYMDTPAGVNFVPEVYVNITDTFKTKVEMLRQHKSQNDWMTVMFGYDMEAFLEIPAKFRGLQAGCRMAEAFRPSYRWGRMLQKHFLPGC
ncbi:MAG: PIG-L family deacetylase [Kiritimatiellae bacterium]|nr:PIG-L family deacetylase [Kiritimatiellia bacterium]MDD5520872.1 PIG-L family deacetylase [Kiritimatiellia bacterium]